MIDNSGLKHFYREYHRPDFIELMIYGHNVEIYELDKNNCFIYSPKNNAQRIREIVYDPSRGGLIDMLLFKLWYGLK